jgi:hypothetical protein
MVSFDIELSVSVSYHDIGWMYAAGLLGYVVNLLARYRPTVWKDGRFFVYLVSFWLCSNINVTFVVVYFHLQNCYFIYISYYFNRQKYDYCPLRDYGTFTAITPSPLSHSRRMWFEPIRYPGLVLALRFCDLPWFLQSNIRIIFQIPIHNCLLLSPSRSGCITHN